MGIELFCAITLILFLICAYLIAHVRELSKIRNRDQAIGRFLQFPMDIVSITRRQKDKDSTYLYLKDMEGHSHTIAGPFNSHAIEAMFKRAIGEHRFNEIHWVEPWKDLAEIIAERATLTAGAAQAPQWKIRTFDAALAKIREPDSNFTDFWLGRAITLLAALVPAVNAEASRLNAPVDEALVRSLAKMDKLEQFVRDHAGTAEAARIDAYLFALPGYVRGVDYSNITNNCHHYLAIKVLNSLL